MICHPWVRRVAWAHFAAVLHLRSAHARPGPAGCGPGILAELDEIGAQRVMALVVGAPGASAALSSPTQP